MMDRLHKAFNNKIDKNITKIEINNGFIGDKEGFNFSVYWDEREYPNFVSALYKTRLGAKRKAIKYLETGQFSLYGNAE